MADETKAGNPRLLLTVGGHAPAGSPAAEGRVPEFQLTQTTTTIGSDESQDIQLPDIDAEHAVVRYDADTDEYFFEVQGTSQGALDAAPVESAGIHHGDRISVGQHTLVFQRDEPASHVRSADQARQGGDRAGGALTGAGGDHTEPD
jgi:pSer/pThr/pTyr-binding forkhead associated (FHA) protein